MPSGSWTPVQEYIILLLHSDLTTLKGVTVNVLGVLEKLSASPVCMFGVNVVKLKQGSLNSQIQSADSYAPYCVVAVIVNV